MMRVDVFIAYGFQQGVMKGARQARVTKPSPAFKTGHRFPKKEDRGKSQNRRRGARNSVSSRSFGFDGLVAEYHCYSDEMLLKLTSDSAVEGQ